MFYFVLKKRLPDSKEGTIKNISIANVTATSEDTSRIMTTINKPFEKISISNLRIKKKPEITLDERATHLNHGYEPQGNP